MAEFLPDAELLDLAGPYALDAVDDDERRSIEDALVAADEARRAEFHAAVRAHRETMAEHAATTAVPPPAALFEQIAERLESRPEARTPEADEPAAQTDVQPPTDLDRVRASRRRRFASAAVAAAAAVIVAVVAVTVTQQVSDEPTQPIVSQVLDASDVRTSAGTIGPDGTATVMYSEEKDAAVLVMNDAPPPDAGTIYQIWLMRRDQPPASAGMMDAAQVTSSTTAVLHDIDDATAVAFSVEPPGGSAQPTGPVVATVALS